MNTNYIDSSVAQFEYYKSLGDKTMTQISDQQLHQQLSNDSNSIATIVNHMVGNMLSRWTNFRTSDGEKKWRNRDQEFYQSITTKDDLIQNWQLGWDCLFKALATIKTSDLNEIIYIRNQGHTITEAIQRQLCHYSYHVGQIVFLGKYFADNNWKSLSIPKGDSTQYNTEKFKDPKNIVHFTKEFLKNN